MKLKIKKRFDIRCIWNITTEGIQSEYVRTFKKLKSSSDVIESILKVPAQRCYIFTYFYTYFGDMYPFYITTSLTSNQLQDIYNGKNLPVYILLLDMQQCDF